MKTKGFRDLRTELLKDLFFPARCPICSDAIPIEKRARLHISPFDKGSRQLYYDGLICRGCLDSLKFITDPFCKKCGKQLAGRNDEMLCSDCLEKERLFDECRCLVTYDETAREIMAEIKYNSKKEYMDIFALLAADRLGDWLKAAGASCLVPVPVHGSRLKSRGFNQAEVLAEGISAFTGIPVRNDVLIRLKNTAAQKNLGADDRLLNLQNAFTAVGKLKNGEIPVIIDDIYTTGSTMEACTEGLLGIGARRVYGLCVCAGEDTADK
ncbi:MAG: ComF family protein [Eubacteriales bacterium]|nr:ComF family protein [Eubacteriales bacterium]